MDVAAAGVNYIDTYHRQGLYPKDLPFTPGTEGAGVVRALGPDVTGFAVGDHVAWADAPGSYAQQAVVPANRAFPVPDGVDDEVAAAAMLQGLTAHYLVTSTYPVKPGDTVLVHAAAGGVGLLLVQVAKSRGGKVIGTVSTAEKEALAREAGADEVIRYTETDFAEEVGRLTGGVGVAAVYDGVGKDTFDGSLDVPGHARHARPVRRVQRPGAAGRPAAAQRGRLAVPDPARRSATTSRRPRSSAGAATSCSPRSRPAALDVRIGGRYPLAEARTAHEDLEGRRTTGKLLLDPVTRRPGGQAVRPRRSPSRRR